MELSLSFQAIFGLFVSMVVLAAMPGISVLLVSTRAMLYGFSHGVAVAVGIVLVDILFISIALFGMTLLLPWLGKWEWLIRLVAAGYLFWLAIHLWRQKALKISNYSVDDGSKTSLTASFVMGCTVTLADQKAILFYMGFFPAWLDISLLTTIDSFIIILITLFTVGGVKSIYAYLAVTVGQVYLTNKLQKMNKLAAILLLGIGVIIIFPL